MSYCEQSFVLCDAVTKMKPSGAVSMGGIFIVYLKCSKLWMPFFSLFFSPLLLYIGIFDTPVQYRVLLSVRRK